MKTLVLDMTDEEYAALADFQDKLKNSSTGKIEYSIELATQGWGCNWFQATLREVMDSDAEWK